MCRAVVAFYFFEEVFGQHDDFSVMTKALNCCKVANSLLQEVPRGHDFQDVK
jgi:hypothetical protein